MHSIIISLHIFTSVELNSTQALPDNNCTLKFRSRLLNITVDFIGKQSKNIVMYIILKRNSIIKKMIICDVFISKYNLCATHIYS